MLVGKDTVRAASATNGGANGRLESWKEIALYLRRDVTTVRRWEKREGLPIHRHLHRRRDSVYAYVAQIDQWWENRRGRLTEATPTGPAKGRQLVPSIVAIVAVAAIGGFTTLALTRRNGAVPKGVVEHRILMPPPWGTSFADIVVSPDGRRIAFTVTPVRDPHAKPTLWIQSLDSVRAQELRDTENASLPFWSPTSDAVGFFSNGHLWTMDLAGASPRKIAVATDGRGATWGVDGTIVFAPDGYGRLYRVPAAGGVAEAVTTRARGEAGHVWPEFLPDGKHFLYLAHPGGRGPAHQVLVASLDGSLRREIVTAESGALLTANGYLHYVRDRQLLSQRFDLDRLAVMGEPTTVARDVLEHRAYPPKRVFSVSSVGVVVYRTRQSPSTRLTWRDRTGRQSAMIDTPAEYQAPTLSPDDSQMAYELFSPVGSHLFGYGPQGIVADIHIRDHTGRSSQLTSHPGTDCCPVWSPDGTSIVFSSNQRNGAMELFHRTLRDPTSERALTTVGLNPAATSWSADGRHIIVATFDPKTRGDLWSVSPRDDRKPMPLVQTGFGEEQGQISPDGRWLAYTSDESGLSEVWVTSFPDANERWRISSGGGSDPRWRRDGKELFYIANDRQLMAVSIGSDRAFTRGNAVALFDTGLPPFWYEARNSYDVARDGRFLFMVPIEDDRSAPATIILNRQGGLTK